MRRHDRRALFGAVPTILFAVLAIPRATEAQQRIEVPGEDRPLGMELEDLYTVGAMDGEEWETFSSVTSVAFDREGNLFILDRGNARVVKVGPGGEFLAQLGRPGEGPGEFGHPMSMAVFPDGSVAVFDLGKRGFTLFEPDGNFDTTVPLASGFEAVPGNRLLPHPSGAVVSAGMRMIRMTSAGVTSSGSSSSRPVFGYSLADGSSQTLFEAWKPGAGEMSRPQSTGSAGRMVVYASGDERAFDPELHLGVLPDGRLVVVDSVGYAVKVVEEGNVASVLARPVPARPVTRRVREMEKARRLEAMESGRGGGTVITSAAGGSVSRHSAGEDFMRERIENLAFAEEIPVVAGLAVDPSGRLWVERAGDRIGEKGPIDLLTADGEYEGSLDQEALRIPDAFGPGGLVAFIERDELDVPRVEVKRVSIG